MKILLLEDNRDIAESIGDFLGLEGFNVDYAMDGMTAMHLATINDYDMYVFDIGVPGADGITLCRRLRNDANDQTPVLFVTALEDKVMGFDSGCDDYMVKPFQLQELLIRIKAIYKRVHPSTNNVLQVDDLKIDKNTHEVFRENKKITLTPVGYKIVLALAYASPNVVTREKLEELIWGPASPPDSDSLRSHLYGFRSKVDKPFPYPLIHTIHKQGFRLYKA